jgi:hypothetical protein
LHRRGSRALLRWLVDHAGLQRPYRFDRTFTVVATLALVVVVGTVAVRLSLRDELTLQTPRGRYFLYRDPAGAPTEANPPPTARTRMKKGAPLSAGRLFQPARAGFR